MPARFCMLAVIAVSAAIASDPLAAQVRASEPATVTQTIDGTKITVDYSRPRVRARDTIFGKVVHWNEVWTPGANWATTLETSRDLTIEGKPLHKGKYSVWIVVRKEGEWTAVLDPRHKRYHTQHPDSTAEQVRFPARKGTGPFAEVLTWSFPQILATGGTLALSWGTLAVPFEIKVTPSYSLTMERALTEPFLGRYSLGFLGGPSDSAAKPLDFTVYYEKGSLMGRWDPSPWGPDFAAFILIPIEKTWFLPGFLEKGSLYDVERDMLFDFAVKDGKATGFVVRATDDKVFARADRKP